MFDTHNKFGLNESYKMGIENKNIINSIYQNTNQYSQLSQMSNQSYMNGIYYKKEQTINTIYDKKSMPKKQHKTLFKFFQYEELTSNNINNNNVDTTNHIRFISNSIVKNNIFNNGISNNLMNNNENRNIVYNVIHYEDYSNNNINKDNLIIFILLPSNYVNQIKKELKNG